MTKLLISKEDELFEFDVPTEWLKENLGEDESLEDFLEEYTSDDAREILEMALLDGIVSEIPNWVNEDEDEEF